MFKEFSKKCQPVEIDNEIHFAVSPKLTPELYTYDGLSHTLELQKEGHIVLTEPEPDSGLRFAYSGSERIVWPEDFVANIRATEKMISELKQ